MILSLHPDHIADLRRSGLTDQTIESARISSVPPDMIRREIGFDLKGLASCYRLPYNADFARYRCFYLDGATAPKYLQRRGTSNRLYVPERVKLSLHDTAQTLLITEGEKKALKAAQEGLDCIAISGWWSWSDGKGELITDFDRIALEGRTVELIPDSDWQQPNRHGYRKNLKSAIHRLTDKLRARGARIFIRLLPEAV